MNRTANTPSGTRTSSTTQHTGTAGRATTRGPLSRRMLSLVLATTACTAGIALQAPARAMADDTLCGDTTAGMNLGIGAETYISESVDQTTMKDDGLAGVISWRQDALNSTARLWDGMTVKDYLAQHNISQDAYLHPQWSHDLERIAIQRAAETNVSWSHTRPNGQEWNSVTTTSGTRSVAEVLATDAMPDAIGEWAQEKQQVLDHPDADNSQTAGHYLFLIDPDHQSYGFADASGNAGVGETSDSPAADQGTTGWQANCSFHVPTLAKDLTGRLSPTTAAVGQVKRLRASATGTWPGWFNAQQQSVFQLRGTFATDDATVASVDGDGLLAAQSIGTTNVSITSGDQQLPLGVFSVNGRQITTVTNPAAVTTASGNLPVLPSTVTTTWNDGVTSEEAVTWDALPNTWKNRAGGRFTVTGSVHGWTSPVKVTVIVTPATLTSVSGVSVTTGVGVAPTLPATVPATWSNGDTTSQPVAWDAPAASSYAHPGTFTVTGRVTTPDGRVLPVTATVTVQRFLVPVGAMPKATGLLGEASGDRFADVWGIDAAGTLDFHRYAGTSLVKVGVRARQLQDVSLLIPIPDENGDHRDDVLYRTKSDGAMWIGYNLGNGYIQPGPRVGLGWNGIDQIFYAGQMIAGSPTQYVVGRHADGTLWRYPLTSKGLSHGTRFATRWSGMRLIMSAGNMWGDAAWDVVGIEKDGTMYGYRNDHGTLRNVGAISRGWSNTVSAFVPGDLTGDGRLDMIGVRTDGSVWAYANTTRGWTGLGRRATGFHYTVLG